MRKFKRVQKVCLFYSCLHEKCLCTKLWVYTSNVWDSLFAYGHSLYCPAPLITVTFLLFFLLQYQDRHRHVNMHLWWQNVGEKQNMGAHTHIIHTRNTSSPRLPYREQSRKREIFSVEASLCFVNEQVCLSLSWQSASVQHLVRSVNMYAVNPHMSCETAYLSAWTCLCYNMFWCHRLAFRTLRHTFKRWRQLRAMEDNFLDCI